MPEKSWKRAERMIAKVLGGERVGPTGEATPDVVTEQFAIEVKTRKALPAWLKAAMAQASVNAGEKMPLVVLHELGTRYDQGIVCMTVEVLRAILEGSEER